MTRTPNGELRLTAQDRVKIIATVAVPTLILLIAILGGWMTTQREISSLKRDVYWLEQRIDRLSSRIEGRPHKLTPREEDSQWNR